MYFAKLPILIFVMRTFGIHTWLRYTGYFLMIAMALCFFASAMWTGAHCSPGLHTVDTLFLVSCVKSTYHTTVSRNSLSLAVDVVIFVLPLPFVVKLKLSRRKKIGVALVFLTGSFGIIAAVVSLYYQTGQAAETSSSITNAMLTTIIECCTFLMVSCAPALRLFWSRYLGKTAFAAKLGLDPSTAASTSRKSRDIILGQQQALSKSGQEPIRVTTHHYIELQETSGTGVPAYMAKVNDKWTHGDVWEGK
ncbi:hypothetical protein MMYC01_203924 [Madurella mycetomatis]|uniref:Rhodopsin domain-containing protein n=1 Tax=Madurella mycetomatis TaxID=100816 RepID=A0A175WB71_9PEZI|nr:hypothetical protein MMYC01_203924 [Madurella mycetomatis]